MAQLVLPECSPPSSEALDKHGHPEICTLTQSPAELSNMCHQRIVPTCALSCLCYDLHNVRDFHLDRKHVDIHTLHAIRARTRSVSESPWLPSYSPAKNKHKKHRFRFFPWAIETMVCFAAASGDRKFPSGKTKRKRRRGIRAPCRKQRPQEPSVLTADLGERPCLARFEIRGRGDLRLERLLLNFAQTRQYLNESATRSRETKSVQRGKSHVTFQNVLRTKTVCARNHSGPTAVPKPHFGQFS